ncbi:asparagine synthase (glutamine-hydrolyzing) [Rheinheimera sp. F8]|uniref:asparagine synthase (glutamine-hydrolyzing) n=1 Tax=Rheinheimera sp. F8 TaxID=1763998 RepID=UPI000B1950A5|nr:asparagine synthase (glutamine-hydrolyzing) [Rheinheimera sp. F8]
MCAIAGIYNVSSDLTALEIAELVTRMAGLMAHRGPDDQGFWQSENGRCAMSHRRLSIVDTTSGGHQPMTSNDGSKVIVFNGEVYNFQELRDTLIGTGSNFKSKSDTEVLLEGLNRKGIDFLTYIDGMFGFGLFDSSNDTLLLARDAFGEKPLYYTFQNGIFAFSSELKALTLLPGFDPLITDDLISTYLAFQMIPAPYTIYHHCYKLEPGHTLRISPTGPGKPIRYAHWQSTDKLDSDASIGKKVDELHELLFNSVRRRLIADVPIGAFLSGGVDSSTTVAIMTKEFGHQVQSFSVGFKDCNESEHEDARNMANLLGSRHDDIMIDPANYVDYMKMLAAVLDEPNIDSSCVPTYFVSKLARSQVTVAMTGDGGDEMFAGYSRYFQLADEASAHSSDIKSRKWHVGRAYYTFMGQLFPDNYIKDIFDSVPTLASDLLLEARRELDMDSRSIINRLRQVDVKNYLPVVLAKVDRMSMLNSLECRTPFLSPEIAKFAAGLDSSALYGDGKGKYILRRVAERYIPKSWLERPKKGFGIDPFSPIVKGRLLEEANKLLTDPECTLVRYISKARLQNLVAEKFPNWSFYHLWGILLLDYWLRSNLHRPCRGSAQ